MEMPLKRSISAAAGLLGARVYAYLGVHIETLTERSRASEDRVVEDQVMLSRELINEAGFLVAAQRCNGCGEHIKISVTDEATGSNLTMTLRTDDEGWDGYERVTDVIPEVLSIVAEALG